MPMIRLKLPLTSSVVFPRIILLSSILFAMQQPKQTGNVRWGLLWAEQKTKLVNWTYKFLTAGFLTFWQSITSFVFLVHGRYCMSIFPHIKISLVIPSSNEYLWIRRWIFFENFIHLIWFNNMNGRWMDDKNFNYISSCK